MSDTYFDTNTGDYGIREPIGNQIMEMWFEKFHESFDTDYYWVVLSIANKKSKLNDVFEKRQITGRNPHASIIAIRNAFEELEDLIRHSHKNKNAVICVGWEDGKRRDIYWRYLKRKGYQMTIVFGDKCIFKKIRKVT